MCVCVCVCIHIHTYIYIYIYTHTYIYILPGYLSGKETTCQCRDTGDIGSIPCLIPVSVNISSNKLCSNYLSSVKAKFTLNLLIL